MANYPSEVIHLAQESQSKYGVPASVTLAQWATESGRGTSYLAKNANNYFGMIGTNNGQYVFRNGRKWQKFGSMQESFDAHGKLLSSGRYAQATAGVTTAEAYIDAIQPIYAPHSDGNAGIEDIWKKIIRDDNLTQYDTGVYPAPSGSGTPSGSGALSGLVSGLAVLVIVAFILLVVIGGLKP